MSDAATPMDSPNSSGHLSSTMDSSSSESQNEKVQDVKRAKRVLTEAELIAKGKRKVGLHKYLLTFFVFAVK